MRTTVDQRGWNRKLSRLKTLIPDAVRSATNNLAFEVQRSTKQAMQGAIEGGPTRFTQTAIRVQKASRTKPYADVHLGPQRGYLRFIFGLRRGLEKPASGQQYIYIPIRSATGHRINARGNLSGRRAARVFKRMEADKRFYFVDQGNRVLAFRRMGRGGKSVLVGAYVKQARQEQKIDVPRIAQKVRRRRAVRIFDEAVGFRLKRL